MLTWEPSTLDMGSSALGCVHTSSTWCVTAYIVTTFRHDWLWNRSLAVDCPRTSNNTVRTEESGAHFCALSPCPNSSVGFHISAQRVQYSGTVPGHQAWTLPKGLFTFGAREPVPGYWHKMVLYSPVEYPICDCLYTYSISPRQTPFWNMSLAPKTNIVFTQGARAHCCARVQGRDLVLGHRHRARIFAWVLKKRCVHISAQRVPYSGTVPGYQVWTLPKISIFQLFNTPPIYDSSLTKISLLLCSCIFQHYTGQLLLQAMFSFLFEASLWKFCNITEHCMLVFQKK